MLAAWGRQAILPVRALLHPAEWVENNMAFHPGGRHLLTHGFDPATEETTARLWDLEREADLPFPGNPGVVSTAAWDATGERLAFGTPQGDVTICRFPSGEVLQRVSFAGRIARVLFSPDGRYCAVAATNRVVGPTNLIAQGLGTQAIALSEPIMGSLAQHLVAVGVMESDALALHWVRVWDCRQAAFATPELDHPAPIDTLAFHPQGELLATGCRDQFCRVFAVPTEKNTPLFTPLPHSCYWKRMVGITPVPPIFLDEGRGLLTAYRGEPSWCDPRTGRDLHVLQFGEVNKGKDVDAITLSADGQYVVLAGLVADNRHVRIFEVASAQQVGPDLEHRVTQLALSVAFSPNGQTLLTGSSDHTAQLWSVPEGKRRGGPLTHPTSVTAVAFAPDGRHLATAQRGGVIRLWALPAGNPRDYRRSVGAPSFVRLSRDGRFLLPTGQPRFSCERQSTQVLDLTTGQHVGPPLKANGFILDAAFSPDGLQVAAAVSLAASTKEREARPGEQPGQLLLWDWRAGKLQHEPLPLASEPRSLNYSSDGRRLALICAKGELVVFDPVTGKTLRHWQAHNTLSDNIWPTNCGIVRFSPDNRNLLTFGPPTNSVCVWDALTGQLRHELPHKHNWCHDVGFSPDGQLVATAGLDNWVYVWELATGEKLASLQHPDWAFTAVFSPDGKYLLTACRDHMARLWDWRTDQQRSRYTFEHEHEVSTVAFTPNGRHVLSTSDDGVLKIWERPTGKPVCPPFALGGWKLTPAMTPDGRRVACGSSPLGELSVLYLADWLAPSPLEPDDLCLWGEIVSGQRIEAGGGVTNLTAEEWLARWRAFRSRHPTYRTMDPMKAAATGLRNE
jgi:WD40 repeat protein